MATQTEHPWRATVRTVVQMTLTLAASAPLIVAAVTQQETATTTGVVAAVLAIAGAITRLFQLPVVNQFIETFIPWLAPQPPNTDGYEPPGDRYANTGADPPV